MAPGLARARSNTSGSTTSNRPQPLSRASTTSLNAPSIQPAQAYCHVSESSYQPPPADPTVHYTPEEMISRSQQQLTNPDQEYIIDPSLQDNIAEDRSMSEDHAYNANPDGMRPIMPHPNSFDGKDGLLPVTFNDDQTQDDGTSEMRKKRGSASSLANDLELRRLFKENHYRSLKEVASSVLANERGPRSEKTKQIFAMNW